MPGIPAVPRWRAVRWKRVAVAIGTTFCLLVGMLAVGGYALYQHLNGNITVLRVEKGLLRTASNTRARPENILVMGSDTRVGQQGIGGLVGMRSAHSDVVMLVHLSASRKHAIVMSVPRDTWVTLPRCRTAAGTMGGGYGFKFNQAFTIGGPACTIRAFEQLTAIPIDHFVVVDFVGVRDIIDAIGGVHVCLKSALYDPVVNHHGSGLNLPAGPQVVMGEQGLALLRARYAIGDGSDTSRLDRQHHFIGDLVHQVENTSLLTDPLRLYRILDVATRSITTDPGLGNLLALKDLAASLRALKPANVTLLTMPWHPRGDGANVLLSHTEARPIFQAIKNDTPYPPVATTTAATQPRLPPSAIHVTVLNGSGVPGTARRAANALAAQGFHIVSIGNAPTPSTATVVSYYPGGGDAARSLTAAVEDATTIPDAQLANTLVLTIGTTYTGIRALTGPTPTAGSGSTSPPYTAHVQTAQTQGCW